MKRLFIAIIALLSVVILYSCKKKYTVVPPPTPTSSIHDSIEFNYTESLQEFSISGASGGDFVTAAGVKVHVPYYSFRNIETGDTIFGTVKIDLFESLDPSHMILTNRTTTATNEIMATDGMIRMNYTVNNNPIMLGDSVLFVRLPVDVPNPNMLLFNGTEDATGFVDWAPSLTDLGALRPVSNAVENIGGLIQNYDSVTIDKNNSNWISFSRLPVATGSKTAVTLTLPERHNNTNTFLFVHFNGFKSVMQGFFDGDRFVTPATIPVGSDISIILFSEIDGNYYSTFINDLTIGSSYSASITPEPTTYADMINSIVNL